MYSGIVIAFVYFWITFSTACVLMALITNLNYLSYYHLEPVIAIILVKCKMVLNVSFFSIIIPVQLQICLFLNVTVIYSG